MPNTSRDPTRGGVGGREASFGNSPSRNRCPTSSATDNRRHRRCDPLAESGCPVGGRSEAEPQRKFQLNVRDVDLEHWGSEVSGEEIPVPDMVGVGLTPAIRVA